MKLLKRIADNIVAQIIFTFIIVPFLGLVISKIRTGNWFGIFKKIPLYYYIIFFLIITIFWLIFIIIKQRKLLKNLQKNKLVISDYAHHYTEIFRYPYAGVIWVVKSREVSNRTCAKDLMVYPYPRCPKCETELEESDDYLGYYIWNCVNADCKFKKRNSDSFETEKERVLKNVIRDFEIGDRKIKK